MNIHNTKNLRCERDIIKPHKRGDRNLIETPGAAADFKNFLRLCG
jgi:hypothetical protein